MFVSDFMIEDKAYEAFPKGMQEPLRCVIVERLRQELKWGEQNHDPFTYGMILGEEYGEFCQAALHLRFFTGDRMELLAKLRAEAVQVAAVALAIVECIDRNKWSWPVPQNELPDKQPL